MSVMTSQGPYGAYEPTNDQKSHSLHQYRICRKGTPRATRAVRALAPEKPIGVCDCQDQMRRVVTPVPAIGSFVSTASKVAHTFETLERLIAERVAKLSDDLAF
ncbi:MAG: hypothetical protein Q9173_004842 [Seirophora scorigena]